MLLALLQIILTSTGRAPEPHPHARPLPADPVHPSYVAKPPRRSASFGTALTSCPDVDGDGKRDVLIGAPDLDDRRGCAFVVSSATGRMLRRLPGREPLERFGAILQAERDLNGDGCRDVAIGGAPPWPERAFNVLRTYLDRDWNTPREYEASVGDWHPYVEALALDDRDGDAIPDWVIVDAYVGGASIARSRIGDEMLWIRAASSRPSGWTMDGGGIASLRRDFDGDGRDDLVLAQYFGWDAYTEASLSLCSSGDGSVSKQVHLSSCGYFAYAIATGRDVDGDGIGDIAVGAPDMEGMCGDAAVEVYSGVDLARIRRLDELNPRGYNEGFGASVALLRDLDGDGHAEIAVGCAETEDHGDDYYAIVFSGKTGHPLSASYTDHHHVVVAALDDDVDGDGIDDLLLGLP